MRNLGHKINSFYSRVHLFGFFFYSVMNLQFCTKSIKVPHFRNIYCSESCKSQRVYPNSTAPGMFEKLYAKQLVKIDELRECRKVVET